MGDSPDLVIRRLSLPDTLAEALRERILTGEFQEGDQLVQEAIAKEYGVSRMPVREALRQLDAAGLVVLKHHKGAIVKALSTEQIAELFELRAILEGELLTHALPLMTKEDLAAAGLLLDQLEAAYHKGEVGKWGELNWAFHRSLYLPARRVQTLAIVQSINVHTDRYIRLLLLLTQSIAGAETEHREFLALCESRQVEEAVAYLKKHITAAGAELLRVLAESRAAKAA
jgi:DNA-binding GntR family transcriptional regulator